MRSATRKRVRDYDYLTFIHQLCCVACERGRVTIFLGYRRPIHAHHAGVRGMSQMADDRTAVPLCEFHHERSSPMSVHGPLGKNFWAHFGMDKEDVIRRLNELYDYLLKSEREKRS